MLTEQLRKPLQFKFCTGHQNFFVVAFLRVTAESVKIAHTGERYCARPVSLAYLLTVAAADIHNGQIRGGAALAHEPRGLPDRVCCCARIVSAQYSLALV